MKCRLLRLVAVGNQATDEVDPAVHWGTMPRMLNLRDVLELVYHGFDDRTFASKQLVIQTHQLVLHVASRFGEELDVEGLE